MPPVARYEGSRTDSPLSFAYNGAMANTETTEIQQPGTADAGPVANTRSNDVAAGDWDDLFNAVKGRLKAIVEEWLATANGNGPPAPSAHMRAVILECAGALDQLHDTLVHEAGRRHQEALTLPAVTRIDVHGREPVPRDRGRDAGETLLEIVSGRLARAYGPVGPVLHLGSDEFASLLREVPSREQLSHLACNLLEGISGPIATGAQEISVRPTNGSTSKLGEPTGVQAPLHRAGAATPQARQRQSDPAYLDERSDSAHGAP